ncbi:MAG: hypothetical protein ACFFC7_03930 [Candidatus Hermodarchaeota archaeon]
MVVIGAHWHAQKPFTITSDKTHVNFCFFYKIEFDEKAGDYNTANWNLKVEIHVKSRHFQPEDFPIDPFEIKLYSEENEGKERIREEFINSWECKYLPIPENDIQQCRGRFVKLKLMVEPKTPKGFTIERDLPKQQINNKGVSKQEIRSVTWTEEIKIPKNFKKIPENDDPCEI